MKKERKIITLAEFTATAGETCKLNLITDKSRRQGKVLYVVMDKFRTTVLQQKGLSKPFSTSSRKYAELVALELGNGDVVETLADAIRYVSTSPVNLPHTHPKYNADKAATKLQMRRFS